MEKVQPNVFSVIVFLFFIFFLLDMNIVNENGLSRVFLSIEQNCSLSACLKDLLL
jgi:hypothetical protein